MNRIYIFIFFILALILRLPAIFLQELPPFQFCDEDIYSNEVFKMLMENRFFTQEFRSGGINIYPAYILGKIFSLFAGRSPDLQELIIITRLFLPGILNAGTVFVLYRIGKILYKDSLRPQFFLLLGFLISPMIAGVSRIWYPDHYIIFFSSLTLYNLLDFIVNQEQNKSIYRKIGISLGLIISTKYTGFLMVIPLLIAFILNYINTSNISADKNLKNFILRYFQSWITICLFALGIILIFQLSVFNDPEGFIEGFKFNLNNYSRFGSSFNFSGVLFYFVILFITSLGGIGFLLYLTGGYQFYKKDRKIFYLLISFPIFIIIYLGKANLVINRNMILALPFILPLFSTGLELLIQRILTLALYKKITSFIILAIFFLIDPIYKTIEQLTVDLKTDSRIMARQWIEQNLPITSKVMHNEFCSGESPAKPELYDLIKDQGNLSEPFEFYVYNNWWDSSIKNYFSKSPLLLEKHYSQLHYLHLNEKNIFTLHKQSSQIEELRKVKKLEVVNEFNSAGPLIIILKKVR